MSFVGAVAASVRKVLANYARDIAYSCLLVGAGNFTVAFTGALNDGIDDGGIEFRGTEATLKIDRVHLAVYPEGVRHVPGSLAPEPEIFVRSEHDGTLDNVRNFLDCLRTRETPNASIHAGFEAARTSWIGNIAFKRGMKTVFDAAKGKVVA